MGRPLARRAFLGAVGSAALAGCVEGGGSVGGGGGRSTGAGTGDRGPDPGRGGATSGADADGPAPPTADEHLPLTHDPDILTRRAVSGGPPKDGIPSIDEPAYESPGEADEWLDDGDPVFGLATGGEARAYPQAILVFHEICNDVVGGTPVSVTYCPLTGTAMGFHRGETTFGVSGRLLNNNLIMYDRGTETWWPQVLATAIPGVWNVDPPIRSLSEFRVVWTTWARWRAMHPETTVLSRRTGYIRNYGADPYGSYNPRGGYYALEEAPMFRTFAEDDRLPPKQVVIGARAPDGAVAIAKDRLAAAGVVEATLGDSPVVAVHDPALDTGYVYRNPDGRSFAAREGEIVEAGGGASPPDALPLRRVLAFDAMWFAWSGFYPETSLHA